MCLYYCWDGVYINWFHEFKIQEYARIYELCKT